MSSIRADIVRINDTLCVKTVLSLDHMSKGSCEIEFKIGQQHLSILHSSDGSIYEDKVHLTQTKAIIEMILEYQPGLIECIISYLNSQNLLAHEALQFEVDKLQQIASSTIAIERTQSVNDDFMARMGAMFLSSDKTWRFVVAIQNNIHIQVLKSGGQRSFLAFGENNPQITCIDFIFPVDVGTTTIIIPKELVWGRYNLYSINARLGCYLLAQADFHNIQHLYHKIPVSNTLPLSDLSKMNGIKTLAEFKTPVGLDFDAANWEVRNQLPIYMGDK